MASVEQCEAAIDVLVERLHSYPADMRRENIPDRTIELALLDLDVTFRGRLHGGELVDVHQGTGPKPHIRLTMDSDDLIELTEKRLRFSHAWATGRLHLDASLRDLLRLRSLL